jgi:hypothetical protein
MVLADAHILIQQKNVIRRAGDEFTNSTNNPSIISDSDGNAYVAQNEPVQVMGDEIEIDPNMMVVGRPYMFLWDGVHVAAIKQPDDTIDFYAIRNK